MDFLGRARTFVRVVESGSLSSAARSLGTSLAATSRQISSLEQELGVALLLRTTRGQRLTHEGERFHEHALRLARDAEAAVASVRPDGAVAGDLVMSASVSLGLLRVIPALPALFAAHPGLRLALRLEERAADLVGEGVDVALRAGLTLPDTTAVIGQAITSFRQVIVASPALLRAQGTPRGWAALGGQPAVLALRSPALWERIDEAGQPHTVAVDPKLRVGSLLGIREAAIAGLGFALLPEFAVTEALAARTLRRVLPSVELRPATVHALYRAEMRGSPRLQALIAHLRATVPLNPRADVVPRRARASRRRS
jgi:DNA-binding transcriptional LysR family regulator